MIQVTNDGKTGGGIIQTTTIYMALYLSFLVPELVGASNKNKVLQWTVKTEIYVQNKSVDDSFLAKIGTISKDITRFRLILS
jgi:hypothetical protein